MKRAKFVTENVSFERGNDPRKTMKVGMEAEKKLNYLISKLKEFDLNFRWEKENWAAFDYSIREIISAKSEIVYGKYFENGTFIIGDKYSTSSIDSAISVILKYKFPEIDKTINNLNRIKEFIENHRDYNEIS